MARGSIVPRYTQDGKVYTIRYRIGKKQKCRTIGPNKKEAERVLAQIMSELNNGTYTQPKEILFKDFAREWLESYARPRIKETTFESYSHAISYHLNPRFGDYPLTYITEQEIRHFIAELSQGRSAKTVNNILIQLKTMFKYAKRWGYLKENPASEIDKLREEHREMDFLKPDEIKLLLDHAAEPYKTIFLLAVLTGMRRGELLALQWGDIDWNSNTIFVRRSLYYSKTKKTEEDILKWQFIAPKSKRSIRAIVMSPKLKEALEIHKIKASINPYDLVFCNEKGSPMDPNNMVKRHFLPTLRFAGLRKVRFHDLRHSYTALLVSQNENVKFIQSQLGHASIQTTLDRYGHLLPSVQGQVGEKIDSQVFDVEVVEKVSPVV